MVREFENNPGEGEVEVTRIYVRHVREAGYCAPGLRTWLKARGLSLRDFLDNGIDAEVLRKLDDSMAEKVIEVAEREERGQ